MKIKVPSELKAKDPKVKILAHASIEGGKLEVSEVDYFSASKRNWRIWYTERGAGRYALLFLEHPSSCARIAAMLAEAAKKVNLERDVTT